MHTSVRPIDSPVLAQYWTYCNTRPDRSDYGVQHETRTHTGLFYFSAIAVMPALAAVDDRTLVDAMQQMIVKIENPAFFLTFLGAPALAAVALVQARRSGSARSAGWIVAGLALYTVMVVITFAVHIPLNDELKEAGDPARIENLAAVRDDFVTRWVAWDIVRAVAATAAFGSLAWALVLRGRVATPGRAGGA